MERTTCTNFSNLFWNKHLLILEGSVSIIRSFHCKHSNDICHIVLLTACEQNQDVLILLVSCQQNFMTYTIAVCTVKIPDDGKRNCPKYVEFYSKNKFEKLVHLVGFIIRIFSWCTVTCTSNSLYCLSNLCYLHESLRTLSSAAGYH